MLKCNNISQSERFCWTSTRKSGRKRFYPAAHNRGGSTKMTQGLTNAPFSAGQGALRGLIVPNGHSDKRIKKQHLHAPERTDAGFVNKLATFLFDDDSHLFLCFFSRAE